MAELIITFAPHITAAHRELSPSRQLSGRERALLFYLLSEPFPGRDELRRQAASVLVCGACTCGCTTIDLVVPDRPEGWAGWTLPVAAEARNFSIPEHPVEVLLHTTNDVLRQLEVVWYGRDDRGQPPLDCIDPAALTLL